MLNKLCGMFVVAMLCGGAAMAQQRTILAIGAHAADMDLTAGAILASAKALGAEVIIGPYSDAMLPSNEEARRYVADVIRQVKPTYVITHWKNSFHKDHRNTHDIVVDAVLMAELEAVKTDHPAYRGVRGVFYADNWEDADAFGLISM
jgi:LmbE family N-acetylglucosaminyl deacetylase